MPYLTRPPPDPHESLLYCVHADASSRVSCSDSDVTGTLQPTMKLATRAVNWDTMSSEEAAQTVRFSDSTPGTPHTILGTKYRIFGAYPEGGELGYDKSTADPGEPVGKEGFCLYHDADLTFG